MMIRYLDPLGKGFLRVLQETINPSRRQSRQLNFKPGYGQVVLLESEPKFQSQIPHSGIPHFLCPACILDILSEN